MSTRDKINNMKATLALAGVMLTSSLAGSAKAMTQNMQKDKEAEKTEISVGKSPLFTVYNLNLPLAERKAALDKAVEQNLVTCETKGEVTTYTDTKGSRIADIVNGWGIRFTATLDQPYKISDWSDLHLQPWEQEALKSSESDIPVSSFDDVYNAQTGQLESRTVGILKDTVPATYYQEYQDGMLEKITEIYQADGIDYLEMHINPSSPLIKSNYTHTIKKTDHETDRMISYYVYDTENDGRLTTFNEDGTIKTISFDNEKESIIRFAYAENNLVGITFQKGGQTKEITLKDSERCDAGDQTAQNGYARLLHENISTITANNIQERVAQNYLKSGDVPSQGSPFYEAYQTAKAYQQLLNQSKGLEL